MWVRASAIRPVAGYARVREPSLVAVQNNLLADTDEAENVLDDAFERFESFQPCLAAHIEDVLSAPLHDSALSLGYFLALSVWLAFDDCHGSLVEAVSPESIRATEELLLLDEELRSVDATESVSTEALVRMQQPALLDFVREHINAALEIEPPVAAADLDAIYRVILVEVLSLSYAVSRPFGFPVRMVEVQA